MKNTVPLLLISTQKAKYLNSSSTLLLLGDNMVELTALVKEAVMAKDIKKMKADYQQRLAEGTTYENT